MSHISFAETLTCEVLVVGGGVAGIRAALTAASLGRDVILLSETPIGQSGSSFYPLSPPWGIMYAEDSQDCEAFYQEIIAASGGCVDTSLVRLMAQHSVHIKALFHQEEIPLRTHDSMGLTGCFGTRPRGAVLADMPAAVRIWQSKLTQQPNVRMVIGWQAASLVMQGKHAAGIVAVDATGRLMLLTAKQVILACGGGEGLYERSYAYGGLMGGGLAMAARRGAQTVNLEFIQFINGTLTPIYGLNYYQFAFVEHPEVVNAQGNPFLADYLPEGCTPQQCLTLRGHHGPFCVEDESRYFDLSIVAEGRKGLGEGAQIIPDPAKLTGTKYVHWRAFLSETGYTTATPMTIAPFCQAFNGGIRMNADVTTDVPGLYVCGEAAGGCHGPNRMGGNAILAAQVFGDLTAKAACKHCDDATAYINPVVAANQFAKEMVCNADAQPAKAVIQAIRSTMQQHAFLERNHSGLKTAAQTLKHLQVNVIDSLGTPHAWTAIQAKNGIDAARLIVCAMQRRTESRGGHYRTDYPQQNQSMNQPMPTSWPDLP